MPVLPDHIGSEYICAHLDDIMTDVRKPGRYVGGELHAVVKPHTPATVVFAFAFPDLYEIGMCHMGLHILYALLNALPAVVCERVFAPAPDMEKRLAETQVPLFTLETKTPLRQVDIVGITVQYELQYTTILTMLQSAGIPFWQHERTAADPIIIGGGPCMLNPEPLAPFFDIMVIGDGEELTPRMVELYRTVKETVSAEKRKEAFFDAIACLDGVYIPHRCAGERTNNGTPAIRKAVVADLGRVSHPTQLLVPNIRTVHDRASIEIMRGCPRQCKFCQARHTYWPVRRRDPDVVHRLARDIIDATGYQELSLQSLSIGDYPCVDEVIGALHEEFAAECVSISFPSLRVEKILKAFTSYASRIRKTGLTLAIEAATQELRDRIGKDIDIDVVYDVFRSALDEQCNTIKLYFMIGLPGETMHDIEAIVAFVDSLLAVAREKKKRRMTISLGIATFIPKPHTDFERECLDTREKIAEKQEYLRREFKKRPAIKCSLTDYHVSVIEALLARGDRSVARLVHAAWERGARLDAWSEYFRRDVWQEICAEEQDTVRRIVYEKPGDEAVLPWDFIEVRPGIK